VPVLLQKTSRIFSIDIDSFNGAALIFPPKKITTNYYRCDSKFHLDLILDMYTKEEKKYGIVLLSGDHCICNLVIQSGEHTEIKILDKFSTSLPKRQKKGGQSAPRFQRCRKEKEDVYVKKIGEMITKSYMIENNTQCMALGLLFAGPSNIKHRVMEDPLVVQYFVNKNLILDIIDTIEIHDRLVFDVYEQHIDKFHKIDPKIMSEFNNIKELIVMASDKLIYGDKEMFSNLDDKMVGTLLISTSIDQQIIDIVNTKNDYDCQIYFVDKVLMKTIGLDIVGIRWF